MSDSERIIVHVALETHADKTASTVDILLAEREVNLDLDGCIAFEVYQDAATPQRVVLYEEWRDMAAFQAYAASDGFKAVGEKLSGAFASVPISRKFVGASIEP